MVDSTSIEKIGSADNNLYALLLENAFNRALQNDGKLTDATLAMEGMSGRKYRCLINNLIGSVPNARYLEVGSWAGSTACSAMEGNKVAVTCIDNWSEFGGPKNTFLENVERCKSGNVEFKFVEGDFRGIDYDSLGKFNVYLFDGPHEKVDQYDGIALALPALDDKFVFIVDDWNWMKVRDGTWEAIAAANLDVVYHLEIRSTQDDSHPVVSRQNSDWHNGYLIAVLEKKVSSLC